MEQKKVLIAAPIHPVLEEQLTAMGYQCDIRPGLSKAAARAIIANYTGIVTSNLLAVDRELIESAVALRWIGRLGSGMDIIDQEAAAERGVLCLSSPEGNANAVAEHALGMLLALKHNILKAHIELGEGKWRREENRGHEIEGMTIGIIGLGHNGSALARKCLALGMEVIAFDSRGNNYDMPGIQAAGGLEPLYAAEVISFHVPLTPETHHYFDQGFLDKMQRPFTLLNLSRGPVVDIGVLRQGMEAGKISAAALDVWDTEPFWSGSPEFREAAAALLKHPAFIGNPHIAGYTYDALYKMSHTLALKISALAGVQPRDKVK